MSKVSSFLYLIVLLLFVLVPAVISVSDSDTVTGGTLPDYDEGTQAGGYDTSQNLGDNILKDIFINAFDYGWRADHHYIFRIFLFIIIVAVVTVGTRRAQVTTRNGAVIITMIVAFISSITLDTMVIIYLFDLMVLGLLLGLIFLALKKWLEAMGLTNHPAVWAIIFFAISMISFCVAGGVFEIPGSKAIKSITFLKLGSWFFWLLGLFFLVLFVYCLIEAIRLAGVNMQRAPGGRRAGAGPTKQLLSNIADTHTNIDKTDDMLRNFTGTAEEADAIRENIKQLQQKRIDLRRQYHRIKSGVDE